MPTRRTLVTCLAGAALAVSLMLPAAAQPTPAPDGAPAAAPVTTYSFTPEDIDGRIHRPEGEVDVVRRAASPDSLVRVRQDFGDRLRASADDI